MTIEAIPSNPQRGFLMPREALVDERVSIKLIGFEPHQVITVRAYMQSSVVRQWESHATYRVDEQGTVDMSSQEPIAGTYEGIDPMGLFWSMYSKPIEKGGSPSSPYTALPPDQVRFTAEVDDQVVATEDIVLRRFSQCVALASVRQGGLAGVFCRPTTQGSYPAMIILGGSSGGIADALCYGALLASHGYAALALAYFRYKNLPKELVNIPLEYFGKAIEWILAQPNVKHDGLGIGGGSRGGELALILGTIFPQVKCVVAYHPSDKVNGGSPLSFLSQPTVEDAGRPLSSMSELRYGTTPWTVPAWLYGGEPLPYTIIPVEKINGPILLISGQEDRVWASASMCERVIQRLEEHNYQYHFKHLSYAHAGHSISFPYVPTTTEHWRHPATGMVVNFGGNPRGVAFANADSWPRVLQFLQTSLGT